MPARGSGRRPALPSGSGCGRPPPILASALASPSRGLVCAGPSPPASPLPRRGRGLPSPQRRPGSHWAPCSVAPGPPPGLLRARGLRAAGRCCGPRCLRCLPGSSPGGGPAPAPRSVGLRPSARLALGSWAPGSVALGPLGPRLPSLGRSGCCLRCGWPPPPRPPLGGACGLRLGGVSLRGGRGLPVVGLVILRAAKAALRMPQKLTDRDLYRLLTVSDILKFPGLDTARKLCYSEGKMVAASELYKLAWPLSGGIQG